MVSRIFRGAWRWFTFAAAREKAEMALRRAENGLAEVCQVERDVLKDEIDRGLAGFGQDAN